MSLTPSNTLHLYVDPAADATEIPFSGDAAAKPSTFSHAEQERAEWLACRETWRTYPSRRRISDHEPYSLGWYSDIEKRRYSRHGHWLPRLFEFNRHRGDQVLCLGEGLGIDGVQFALEGAIVHYCSPSQETVSLARRLFELRATPGIFCCGNYDDLPYPSNSKDVVCVTAMASPIAPIEPVIEEIFRVLKPGGKLLAALPAKYDARFWKSLWFPWQRFYTSRTEDSSHFSCRRVKRLFRSFNELRLVKRHLRRSDIPHLWRWIMLPVLERFMGRYLVIKTFKPVGAGLTVPIAA